MDDYVVLDYATFKKLCWKTMRRAAAKPFVDAPQCKAWAEAEFNSTFEDNFNNNSDNIGFLAGCLSCSARAGINAAGRPGGGPKITLQDFKDGCGDTSEFVMRMMTRGVRNVPRNLDGVCM